MLLVCVPSFRFMRMCRVLCMGFSCTALFISITVWTGCFSVFYPSSLLFWFRRRTLNSVNHRSGDTLRVFRFLYASKIKNRPFLLSSFFLPVWSYLCHLEIRDSIWGDDWSYHLPADLGTAPSFTILSPLSLADRYDWHDTRWPLARKLDRSW